MKKSSNGILAIIVLTLLSAGALWFSVPEWLVTMKPATDFNEISDSELRAGLHVEGDVYALLDSYASEQTWTEHEHGVTPKKTSKIYYILPVGEQSCIGLEVRAEDKRLYNDITDATLSYMFGETEYIESDPVHFEGQIVKMDDELYQYLLEWFQESEYFGTTDEAAIKEYVPSYLMRPFSPGLYTMLAIAGVFVLADVIAVAILLVRRKKRRARAEEKLYAPSVAVPPTDSGRDALKRLQQ